MILNPNTLLDNLPNFSESKLIGLWKYYDQGKIIYPLEGVSPELEILKICPEDNKFLTEFKSCVRIMLSKNGHIVNATGFLEEFILVLQTTMVKLSPIEGETIPKKQFLSTFHGLLIFVSTYGILMVNLLYNETLSQQEQTNIKSPRGIMQFIMDGWKNDFGYLDNSDNWNEDRFGVAAVRYFLRRLFELVKKLIPDNYPQLQMDYPDLMW